MAEVRLDGVAQALRRRSTAVDGLDLDVANGEFVVLLGPTGAGKTTTLRLVAGLERPDAGRDPHRRRATSPRAAPALRDVAFVFQQYSLYPHLSVFDNLAFPLRSPLRREPEAEIARPGRARSRALLRIEDKLQNPATRLSGGQMQRVAIGRALVREPARLPDGRAALVARRQAARRPAPRAQAHPAGPRRDDPLRHPRPDRGHDDGRPHRRARGRPAGAGRHAARDLRPPGQRRAVARRLGSPPINLAAVGVLPAAAPAPAATEVGVRPEDVQPGRRRGIEARIEQVEPLGCGDRRAAAGCRARGCMRSMPGLARVEAGRPPRRVAVPPEAMLFFDADGRRLAA